MIGQIDKAKEHFELSLSINMNHTSAMYKLGLSSGLHLSYCSIQPIKLDLNFRAHLPAKFEAI